MNKIFLSTGIVLALVIGGFVVFNNYIYTEKQGGTELTQEQERALVSAYISENIFALSPEPEVLGGTFYVTDIAFTGANSGTVEYEDGHIALVADFEYSIDEADAVEVVLTNAREPRP